MRRNKGRLKKTLLFHKAATIWISIIVVYTIIMALIIVALKDSKGCSSGSLSSLEAVTQSTQQTNQSNESEQNTSENNASTGESVNNGNEK